MGFFNLAIVIAALMFACWRDRPGYPWRSAVFPLLMLVVLTSVGLCVHQYVYT